MENWGGLWMLHSLKLLLLCLVTNAMWWAGVRDHLAYLLLWSVGLGGVGGGVSGAGGGRGGRGDLRRASDGPWLGRRRGGVDRGFCGGSIP